MNKIRFILPLLALFIFSNSFSQRRNGKDNDRMKAYKIAYITDQLNLTEKEAEKFWPVYNAHETAMQKFRSEERAKFKKDVSKNNTIETISETDAKKLIVFMAALRDKTHKENQTYFAKLKNILTFKKILKLQIAERQFKRRLFDNLKKKKDKRK